MSSKSYFFPKKDFLINVLILFFIIFVFTNYLHNSFEKYTEVENIKTAIDYGSRSSAQTCAEIVCDILASRVPASVIIQIIDRFLKRLQPEERYQKEIILKKAYLLQFLDRKEELQQIENSISPYLESSNISPTFLAKWYRNKAFEKKLRNKEEEAIPLFYQALEIYEKEECFIEMIDTYIALSSCYSNKREFNPAQEKALEAIVLAKKVGATHLLSNPLMKIGIMHKERNELEKALDYYRQSLHYIELFPNDFELANLLINTGNVYRRQGKLKQAIQDYQKAILLKSRLGSSSSPVSLQNNMGLCYQMTGKHKEAIEILQKALRSKTLESRPFAKAVTLNNITLSMIEIEDFDNAQKYIDQAVQLLQKIDRPRLLGGLYINAAGLHLRQHNVRQAMEYAQRSAESINDSFPYVQGLLQSIFGQIHTLKKQFKKAEESFIKAEKLLKKESRDQLEMMEVLQYKALLYSTQKDSINAKLNLDRRSEIIDTLEEEVQQYQRKKHKELEIQVHKDLNS